MRVHKALCSLGIVRNIVSLFIESIEQVRIEFDKNLKKREKKNTRAEDEQTIIPFVVESSHSLIANGQIAKIVRILDPVPNWQDLRNASELNGGSCDICVSLGHCQSPTQKTTTKIAE